MALACCGLFGCFAPQIEDGAIQCGEAGCPPGLVCAGDDVCRASDGASRDVVLAVAREDGPAQLRAFCGGQVQLAWEVDQVNSARTVAWGPARELTFGSIDDMLRDFRLDGDRLDDAFSLDWLRQTRSSGWIDYDRDGDLDLAVSDAEHSLKVLAQRGDGLEVLWKAEDMTEPWGLAWGDFDGDGDADLAVAAMSPAVYRNQGSTFERAWASPRQEDTRSIAWLDLDRDGDLDLVTGAVAGPLRAYRNDGAGQLTESWASVESADVPALAVGDFDGDGDDDLATAGRDQPSRVYRNDRGPLAVAWTAAPPQTTWSVSWFDVDRDGDLDLTLGNHDQASQLLRNDHGTLVPWLTIDVDRVRELSWATWEVEAGRPSACDRVRWGDLGDGGGGNGNGNGGGRR